MDARMMPHDDIERYVLDRMSQVEKTSFEAQMKQDPAITAEVDLQRTIVEGIGEARKAALKNRLSQVPVSSSWFSNAINSGWTKVAAGVVVASTASILLYTQLESDDSFDNMAAVLIDVPEIKKSAEIMIPDRVAEVEASSVTEDPTLISSAIEDYSPAEIEEEDMPANEVAVEDEVLIVEVNLPELGFEGETEAQEEETSTFIDISSIESAMNIDVIDSEEERLYRYFDGSLTLKGDYDSVQYDLLELNSKKGKQYFIEIGGDYYAMPVSKDFRSLDLIVSKSLISALDSLTSLD